MRDPARIDRMLALVRYIWLCSPDLRLGQLIENGRHFSGSGADVFNVEDDALELGLRSLAQRIGAPWQI